MLALAGTQLFHDWALTYGPELERAQAEYGRARD
jgi:hypothetical protein